MTKQNRKSFRRVHPIRRRTSSRRRLLVEQLESRHLLAAVPFGAEPADGSEYMLGDVYVTVVFLESDGSIDPNLENWTSAQKEEVKQKIRDGLAWWEDVLDLQGSTHDLNFVVDFTHADTPVETPYEPLTRSNGDSNLWIQKFLDGEGFDSSSDYASNLEHFNHAQRLAAQTHWAFTIFIGRSPSLSSTLLMMRTVSSQTACRLSPHRGDLWSCSSTAQREPWLTKWGTYFSQLMSIPGDARTLSGAAITTHRI